MFNFRHNRIQQDVLILNLATGLQFNTVYDMIQLCLTCFQVQYSNLDWNRHAHAN